MERTFVITSIIDDSGTEEFFARKKDDFNEDGIPYPGSFVGRGETELYALINLLDKFATDLERVEPDAGYR